MYLVIKKTITVTLKTKKKITAYTLRSFYCHCKTTRHAEGTTKLQGLPQGAGSKVLYKHFLGKI